MFSPYRTSPIKHRKSPSPLKNRVSPIRGRVDARMETLQTPIPRISTVRRSPIKSRSINKTLVRKNVKGASNIGKYTHSGAFCGSVPGTFPVKSRRQAISALAYRRHDLNPESVKKCVCNQDKIHNWNLPSCSKTRTKRSPRY